MKKAHVYIAAAYMLFNVFLSSSFITASHPLPVKKVAVKPACGPFEMIVTNPAQYPVTRLQILAPNTSWTFNNPSFPIDLNGSPYSGGTWSVNIQLAADHAGTVRVWDSGGNVVACVEFTNRRIPFLRFMATCDWYEIEISPLETCP